MAIIVSQIKTALSQFESQEVFEKKAIESARKTAKIHTEEIARAYLTKSSVDARKKEQIYLVSSVGFELTDPQKEEEILKRTQNGKSAQFIKQQNHSSPDFVLGTEKTEYPPVIVGFGPAGMFAGLALARMGYRPIILERGAEVDRRVEAVEGFWTGKALDTATNVQFGEGGAGTFSDGKLTTRINDPRCSFILEELIRHGAPEEIRYRQKPHIGTDLLRHVVKNIRQEIIRLGGQVHFLTKMEEPIIQNGRITAVKTAQGEIPTQALVLAIGHSARIDKGLYGECAGHPALPKGEYQLSWRNQEDRGVYTFCMCPGGFVVASSSEENTVVTNGMSEYARDGENANAALVVSVDGRDFGADILDGVRFQRSLEQSAFRLGGADYRAPAQSAESFLQGTTPDLSKAKTEPTFSCGVKEAPLRSAFPQQINRMLEEGLTRFQRKLPGFADSDAVITGIETRTSSPVRITRNSESLEALGLQGLYPCGEGAGYAGGIVSAAVDGIRVAEQIMKKYAPIE